LPALERSVITVRIPKSQRVAPIVPYAACFAVSWGLIGLESRLRVGELLAALALQIFVGVLLIPLGRSEPRPSLVMVGMIAFLVSVVLLRDGVGSTPGYGTLLLLPVIWAALARRRRELVFAIAGAAIVLFAPIVAIGAPQYPSSGWRSGALLLVIAAVLGGTVLALVETIERRRDETSEMLASQQALRRIATLVATGAQPDAVFGAVAERLAALFGGTVGGIVRFDGPSGVGEIVGGWTAGGDDITGQKIDLAGTSASARVYQTSGPVLIADYGDGWTEPIVEQFDLGGAVAAPILLGGRLWGSAGTSFATGRSIPDRVEQRLIRFAELVAVAIANAEAWETVTHQAATDPVTGLANHRTFHERLNAEVKRATRHGRALSLAVFDLDHFKAINDTHGHQTGDNTLTAVAHRLAAVARAGELVARIGGEEFAWLMPETTQDSAYLAAERARRAIEAAPFELAGPLTISAGVCSNEHATTAHELLNAADRALYGAKHNGRNTTFIYNQDAEPQPA
jgi:diguanylate cyclase (GGDEF)-like protein